MHPWGRQIIALADNICQALLEGQCGGAAGVYSNGMIHAKEHVTGTILLTLPHPLLDQNHTKR